jgi:hypothetical protein
MACFTILCLTQCDEIFKRYVEVKLASRCRLHYIEPPLGYVRLCVPVSAEITQRNANIRAQIVLHFKSHTGKSRSQIGLREDKRSQCSILVGYAGPCTKL